MASTSSTRTPGCCASLLASMQPAEPAPTTTKSHGPSLARSVVPTNLRSKSSGGFCAY